MAKKQALHMATLCPTICLAWLASIAVVAALAIHAQGHYFPHPGYIGLLAIMGAHVGLAGLAVGLLRGGRLWPIVTMLAAIAGWSWLWDDFLSAASREDVASLCLAQAVMVILVSVIGRLVWRSATEAERQKDPTASGSVAARGVRVWHLFGFITVFAVAVALITNLAVGNTTPDDELLWLITNNTTACLGAAWIVLAAHRPLTGALTLCLVLAALSFYGGGSLGDSTTGAGPLLAINGLQTALVMAGLVLWRSLTHPQDPRIAIPSSDNYHMCEASAFKCFDTLNKCKQSFDENLKGTQDPDEKR